MVVDTSLYTILIIYTEGACEASRYKLMMVVNL